MTRMTFSDWQMTMAEIKAYVFDLDDTLAESKQPIGPEIAYELSNLVKHSHVAILTGGQYQQVRSQVLEKLPKNVADVIDVYSCSGSQYRVEGGNVTTEMIPAKQRERISHLVELVAIEQGVWCENPKGQIIEDRLAQITFSALGQQASPAKKSGWDSDKKKRQNLVDRLQPLMPDYDFRIGGSTSIDVTPKGRDKAYGMRNFIERTNYDPAQIVYVGDSFSNSGNDFPIISTNVFCIEVSGWLHTLQLLRMFNNGKIS